MQHPANPHNLAPTTNKRALVNRDRLMNADRKAVADACVLIFDRIQHLPTETRMLALASAFNLMIRVTKLNPQEVMTAVNNLIVDDRTSTRLEPRFSAMEFHLEEDIVSRGV